MTGKDGKLVGAAALVAGLLGLGALATRHVCQASAAAEEGNSSGACFSEQASATKGACVSRANRCTEYGACSLHGDLSGATGETLKMYFREKAEDGRKYDDYPLPDFKAYDLSGNAVRSGSLRGKPTVLVFLAGHCNHSMDSLPILQEMARTYGPRGLRVIGVWLNSGSLQDVKSWVRELHPEYEVWVYPDASLGDTIKSHLVPTYFFIDAKGRVKEKLVGFKAKSEVAPRIASLVE